MEVVNYSIIIPHKNSIQLLFRCLNSIPQRDDIEVIVIDDHSSDNEGLKRIVALYPRVELYINEGYGAGGARNTGLSKAKGRWLLFADCDDYYVEGFLHELDKYLDSEYDVIYFNFYQYIEGKDKVVDEKISDYIKKCAKGKLDVDFVKYRNNAPWNKMVKRDFVELRQIKFEEQPIANDMFFSFQVGYLCKKAKIIDSYLYNYILYKRSQTRRNWNQDKIKTYLENIEKYNGFVEFVNHKEWTHGFAYLILQLYKMNLLFNSIYIIWYYILYYKKIKNKRDKYPSLLKQMEVNTKN